MIMASPSKGVVSAKGVLGEPDQTVRAGRMRRSLRKRERNGFRNNTRKTRILPLCPRAPADRQTLVNQVFIFMPPPTLLPRPCSPCNLPQTKQRQILTRVMVLSVASR